MLHPPCGSNKSQVVHLPPSYGNHIYLVPAASKSPQFCLLAAAISTRHTVITVLCSFSRLSVTSPTSQLILKPFPRFTYVTAHSPTLPLFTYVTAHSPTLLSLLLRHRTFTYVTWRAAHGLTVYYSPILTRRVYGDRVTDFFKLCVIKVSLCSIKVTKAYDPLRRQRPHDALFSLSYLSLSITIFI